MPSGADAFSRKQQQKEAQKAASGGDWIKTDFFSIAGGRFAIVRFLESGDEITFTDIHRIPVAGARYPRDMACLNAFDDGTPCPACKSSDPEIAKKSTKGFFNLIWREGPVYQRDEKGTPVKGSDGKPVITGRADGIFLWKCSYTVLEQLIEKDRKWKGLNMRDAEVKRTGTKMNDTSYTIEPADIDSGSQPLLIPDLQLAEKRYDLKALTAPLDFASLATIIAGGPAPGGPQPTFDRSEVAVTPTADSVFSGGAPVQSSAFTRA